MTVDVSGVDFGSGPRRLRAVDRREPLEVPIVAAQPATLLGYPQRPSGRRSFRRRTASQSGASRPGRCGRNWASPISSSHGRGRTTSVAGLADSIGPIGVRIGRLPGLLVLCELRTLSLTHLCSPLCGHPKIRCFRLFSFNFIVVAFWALSDFILQFSCVTSFSAHFAAKANSSFAPFSCVSYSIGTIGERTIAHTDMARQHRSEEVAVGKFAFCTCMFACNSLRVVCAIALFGRFLCDGRLG